MPIITSIEPQKKKENRFNVFINGQFAFAASAETIFKHHLKTDQSISQETIEKLVKENEYGLLLDKTLQWISSRPHSEKELMTYLNKPNPKAKTPRSELAAQMVVDKLTTLGYINDEEFARWYIESRTRSRPRGKRLLALELRAKGVGQEIISRLLEDRAEVQSSSPPILPLSPLSPVLPQSESDLALKVAQKKLSSYKNLERREFYQKMGAYLARRGFDWETIKAVIDQISEKR